MMQELVQALAIPAGVGVVLWALGRFLPRVKTGAQVYAVCRKAGVAFSAVLSLRIGKKAAAKLEEAMLPTLSHIVSEACRGFVDGALSDNHKKDGE